MASNPDTDALLAAVIGTLDAEHKARILNLLQPNNKPPDGPQIAASTSAITGQTIEAGDTQVDALAGGEKHGGRVSPPSSISFSSVPI